MLATAAIKFLLAVTFVSAGGIFVLGQTDTTETQVWPGARVNIDITPKIALQLFTGREGSEELSDSKWQTSATIKYRIKPLFKGRMTDSDEDNRHLLVVGGGYQYSLSTNSSGTRKDEHRIMFDSTPRYSPGAGFLVQDRNRVEFRWINGEYNFRYRNRLIVERGLKFRKVPLTPYVSGEVFWDRESRSWNQNQLSAGVHLPFRKRLMFDIFYLRKNCDTCSQAHTNAVGVTVNVYFKRKK